MPPYVVLVLLVAASLQAVQAQVVVRGLVREAASHRPLASAHVLESGGTMGTITNREGEFVISLPAVPTALEVRYVGFATEYLAIAPNGPRAFTVDLIPQPLILEELLVTGEEFAENVMRKVLVRKASRRQFLQSTRARGFSRITLESGRAIVLVSEHVFDTYWDRERASRDVTLSKRETGTFYQDLQLDHTVVDLSADRVGIHQLQFYGPTHPDALEHYNFTFGGHRSVDGTQIYDIYVAPKTVLEATFVGRVSVMDSVYALVAADLRPARHVQWAADVDAWGVFYRQQFRPVDSLWLPVDLRMEGRIIAGTGQSVATLYKVAKLTDHGLNVAVPESLYASSQRVQEDKMSILLDDLFLLGRDVVALTEMEAAALERLPSEALTIAEALPRQNVRASDSMVPWNEPQFVWPTIMGRQPWAKFNRADGFLLGVMQPLEIPGRIQVASRLASATASGENHGGLRVSRRLGAKGLVATGGGWDSAPQVESRVVSHTLGSLPALLGGRDYFDHIRALKAYARTGRSIRGVRTSVATLWERNQSVTTRKKRAWPFLRALRPNPPFETETIGSVALSMSVGDIYHPFRFGPRSGMGVEFEFGQLQGEELGFSRVGLHIDTYVTTFYRQRPRPHHLNLRLFGTTYRGLLPQVRRMSVNGAFGPAAGFGMLRGLVGTSYASKQGVALHWEHDFRALAFESLGLHTLVAMNMGIRVFGAHVWTGSVHHEIGASLADLWGSPVRIDLTYRLDDPGVFVGLGLTRLF